MGYSVYSEVGEYTEITNTMKASFVSGTGEKNTRIPGFHSQLFQLPLCNISLITNPISAPCSSAKGMGGKGEHCSLNSGCPTKNR